MTYHTAFDWYLAQCKEKRHDHGTEGARACMLRTLSELQQIGKKDPKGEAEAAG